MTTEYDVQQLASNLHGSGKSLAEFLGELFKGKFVEIYLGDSYEEVSTEQISISYPAVFCGRIVCAYRECLVISAAYINTNKKMNLGKLIFISERAIRAFTPIEEEGSGLEDMFLRSKEANRLARTFQK